MRLIPADPFAQDVDSPEPSMSGHSGSPGQEAELINDVEDCQTHAVLVEGDCHSADAHARDIRCNDAKTRVAGANCAHRLKYISGAIVAKNSTSRT